MNGKNQYLFIEIHWRFMQERLIEIQAQRLDQEYQDVYSFFAESYDQFLLSQPNVESSSSSSLNRSLPDIGLQATLMPMDNRSQSKSSHPEPNISTGQEISRQIIFPQRQQSQMEEVQQFSQSEYNITERPRIQRKTQPYETKNLLPKVRKPHLKFLKERLKEKIYSYEIINKLKKSNTANRNDYLELYTIPEFYDVFEEFFKNKVLYRAVMASGCQLRNKMIFIRKLHIFQTAFRTKEFNEVNRKEKIAHRNKNYRNI